MEGAELVDSVTESYIGAGCGDPVPIGASSPWLRPGSYQLRAVLHWSLELSSDGEELSSYEIKEIRGFEEPYAESLY